MAEGHTELPVSVCVCGGAYVCSILVQSITSAFDRFQNDFVHLFSLKSTSVMWKVCYDTTKVKVTVEGQIFKWTLSGSICEWISKNFAHLFSLTSASVMQKIVSISPRSKSQLKVK